MKLANLLSFLDTIAPFDSAEEWDNCGLLVGDPQKEIDTVLLTVDCTARAFSFAKEQGADVILAHHPLIFNPMRRFTAESMPFQLVQSDIAVIGYHTNFDKAPGGVDDQLAAIVGLDEMTVLEESGFGRIGELTVSADGICTEDLVSRIKEKLPHTSIRLYGPVDQKVHRGATLCGSGDHGLESALEQGADCIIAGELRFSNIMDLLRMGKSVIVLGHGESERPAMTALQSVLSSVFPDVLFLMDDKEYDLTVF